MARLITDEFIKSLGGKRRRYSGLHDLWSESNSKIHVSSEWGYDFYIRFERQHRFKMSEFTDVLDHVNIYLGGFGLYIQTDQARELITFLVKSNMFDRHTLIRGLEIFFGSTQVEDSL